MYKFGDWVKVRQDADCPAEYKGRLAVCGGTRQNSISEKWDSESMQKEKQENPVIVFVVFDYVGVNHRLREFYPKELELVRKSRRPTLHAPDKSHTHPGAGGSE